MFSNTLIADLSHLIDRKWRIHVLQMQETVQGRSVLYANTHVRTWEIRRIFLKIFSYKWKLFIVSWLNIVWVNLFLSVDISLLLRTVFTLKIKKFEWWNVTNLKHFSQYIAFSGKTKGDWGNSCKHIRRHKESNLADYHFFQDLSGKFFHSKPLIFFSFLSLY